MADNTDISLRVTVVNPQGHPLGGTVDLEFQPQGEGQPVLIKGADASKDIDVRGLERSPRGLYQLTVTPGDVFKPASQFVNIPASGFATATVVIDKAAAQTEGSGPNTLTGNLVFDTGLPAAGVTVRLYEVGFAGQDTLLGQVKTHAQGQYAFAYTPPRSAASKHAPALQVRALDPVGKEITISTTKFNAGSSEHLNLVVPAKVQPLAPEFQRLAAGMEKSIGSIANLGQAQEGAVRQDLTLLNQTTNWDARLVALAATAAQQSTATGLGQDILYALFRVGLPTDPALLASVPPDTVRQALIKANQAAIVNLNEQQIAEATRRFQNFASKTLLAAYAAGAPSTYSELLGAQIKEPAQQTAFANLYFSQPTAGAELWAQAAALNIPAATLDGLKLQGKFLYLTFNNAALAQKLQLDIGSAENLPQLADKDYHLPETWQNTLTALAGDGGEKALDALIPPIYKGATTSDRLAAYSGDLARRVRISFPTRTVARMVENEYLPIDPQYVPVVTSFLRAASTLGYNLGRTPLNTFLAQSGVNLPQLDKASKASLKTLHRLYQITPSPESLRAAVKLGFTSAFEIASYSKSAFMDQYAYAFPPGEAALVYGQAQTVSSVTFNVFAAAKALDTSPPVYALSGSSSDRQNARNALVQQFPSMSTLFGNLDFCQCDDCRSVLSPAAYFVDLLDLLGQESSPNAVGNLPLDVLIGNGGAVKGRRPDLGALPLTCANTNTAMPYIDLVNEILEYYIAHNNSLDAGGAYDTGSATTADLTAEPQHIIPPVYSTTLKQAVYPLDLPFDLWIETVRGFLNYFKTTLAQVLDTLRPADTLELFTSSPPTPYYRAEILAESLGISPAEYGVYTATDTTRWYQLYGDYADETTALGDLKNAKTLSQRLGVSYQGLTDLVQTGFLNPGLYPLLFQFRRFGIDMGAAFSFTNQPGYPALTPQQAADFQAVLDGLTAYYKQQNPGSTFDAATWLKNLLTAYYSTAVLVLADPDTGCDFSRTTLQYADGSAARPLDFLKINLFVRLCNKLGCSLNNGVSAPGGSANPWSLDEVDRALQAFFPLGNLPAWNDPGFAQAFGDSWKTALVYLGHLDDLNTRLAPPLGRIALLPFWSDLPVQGGAPLYAQLFLTPSVLNNDFAFDDPNGKFPAPAGDLTLTQQTLAAHTAVVQGALGLGGADIAAILADADVAAPAQLSLDNLSICYRYSLLAEFLQLSVANMISLKALSGLNPFQPLTGNPLTKLADDLLLNQTLAFVEQVAAAQKSGFTVEDLQYLLRHQYDPVGKYQSDPNALMAVVQSIAGGISRIQAQNTVPPDPASMPESLIDQTLSGLFPAAILKTLFTQLTNAQSYTVSAASPAALTLTDPTQAPELTLSFDKVTNTQTLSCKGLLLDWRKAELLALHSNAALNAVYSTLLMGVQQQARAALESSMANILGVWASLVQYEAVATGVTPVQAISDPLGQLTQADPSLSYTYDSSQGLQWLGYRGVLTAAKLGALTALNSSATLAALLPQVQQQALPAYNEMTGSLVAMWCNLQTYKATLAGVAPGSQVDPAAFASALAQAQQAGTITGPVPPIHITYDSVAQVQTLTCTGVLPDVLRAQLAALIPAPAAVAALLAGLLQTVRNQAVIEFQFLAADMLAAAINNPDPYVTPFLGAANLQQQKFAKAELVKVFVPLLVQKLSRQLVLQTLSDALGSDPSLTESLVTDAALLNDPSNPGKSLLQAFLDAGQPGVTAAYYDKDSVLLAGGIAATADTADPTNSVPDAVSCHFEGYLQAPTDGPYRFFAELGNTGVQAQFNLDSPDPAAQFTNPVIQATAAKDGDEASQFAQLRGGVAYHFTLDFHGIGANGAKMLIQGETLPKGALSQIVLYPQQTVDSFARARVLLAKVLQVLQVTGIGLRELSYMVANAAQFNQLDLSALPTQASDDSPQKAAALFAQFLTLADYADLRKGLARGTDGLVDVFEAAATPQGVLASYYASPNEIGVPQAFGIAATTDTADPTNSKLGTASCRFQGYLLVPMDGSYTFFAELGNANAQVTFRLDAPIGTAPLANPVVLRHTAAADGEEDSQAVPLRSGVPYRLMLDFQNLGANGASLLVQGGNLAKGPLNHLLLSPASQLPPWMVLANLTRRDPQVVLDVAGALGPDPHFSNNAGICRMWKALQLIQILGLPVQAVSASTSIATPAPTGPDLIAGNFKNAVKAHYTADQWRPIAQSVFDPLRQKKRDTLVSYLVNALSLENSDQLFEYFLVDPGMEPVVQTSRLRLALSSVQTFIQRCLLNLENGNGDAALDVSPSAIDADWWAWMKRYRVWEANREIFLFPENWMEPEFRLDKTDLYQALEGALLQGDVTQELAQDAFYEYLKGLDMRARLDIVASYLDQDLAHPGVSTLYVLGRTYGTPPAYFYRTYSCGTWSAWQTVKLDIEGDHIVLAIWRGRLNIFWLTFVAAAQPRAVTSNESDTIATLPFNTLLSSISSFQAQSQIQIQLHWSEYVQGKWTNPISSDLKKFPPINVDEPFDPNSQVYVHVDKEVDSNGNEGAVRVLLDMNGYDEFYGFRVTSKNCSPDFREAYGEFASEVVYNILSSDATRYTGSQTLTAGFQTAIGSDGSGTLQTENILQSVDNFEVLTCGNPVVPPFLPANDPAYQEAGSLVSPFFFKDGSNPNAGSQSTFKDERTFFVQPSLTESVIQEWEGWALAPPQPLQIANPNSVNQIKVVAQVPTAGPVPVNPSDPVYSVFPMQDLTDWVTGPSIAVSYGGVAIGKNGLIKPAAARGALAAGKSAPLVAGVIAAKAARTGVVIVGEQGINLSQLPPVVKS